MRLTSSIALSIIVASLGSVIEAQDNKHNPSMTFADCGRAQTATDQQKRIATSSVPTPTSADSTSTDSTSTDSTTTTGTVTTPHHKSGTAKVHKASKSESSGSSLAVTTADTDSSVPTADSSNTLSSSDSLSPMSSGGISGSLASLSQSSPSSAATRNEPILHGILVFSGWVGLGLLGIIMVV